MPAARLIRRVSLASLLVGVALLGTTAAIGSRLDDTVLNQTATPDATGDAGSGPDISSLTITSYTDGSISFGVQFANRTALQAGETAQVYVDLDGTIDPEVDLAVWGSPQTSGMYRV